MKISSDYEDLLRAFSAEGVEFLIAGAYAVIHHTEPRFTRDIDVWVRPSRENALRVLQALARFGAPVSDLKPEDLCDLEMIFQIGVEPVRVDVLAGIPGLEFEEAWKSAHTAHFGSVEVRVLGLESLRTAKRTAGRPQDLLDLALLDEAARRKVGKTRKEP